MRKSLSCPSPTISGPTRPWPPWLRASRHSAACRTVLSDRTGCLKGGTVAGVVVPTPDYVRFANHYGCWPGGRPPPSRGGEGRHPRPQYGVGLNHLPPGRFVLLTSVGATGTARDGLTFRAGGGSPGPTATPATYVRSAGVLGAPARPAIIATKQLR